MAAKCSGLASSFSCLSPCVSSGLLGQMVTQTRHASPAFLLLVLLAVSTNQCMALHTCSMSS